MTIAAHEPARPQSRRHARTPRLRKVFDDAAHRDTARLLIVLAVLAASMALAIQTWGLVALGLAALAAVPLVFVLLVALTVGQ